MLGWVEALECRALLSTFAVNTLDDTVDADVGDGQAIDGRGQTSLRAAVMEANLSGGNDTIVLPRGTFRLSITGNENDGIAGDLDITKPAAGTLTIRGAGVGRTRIDAAQLDRVFELHGGSSLVLEDLNVLNGRASEGGLIRSSAGTSIEINRAEFNGGYAVQVGGAIKADGEVSIKNSTFRRNIAGSGGAVHSYMANVEILNSRFEDNHAMKLRGSSFPSDDYYNGGALVVGEGSLEIRDSHFIGNTAFNFGGASHSNLADPVIISGSTFLRNVGHRNVGGVHASGAGVTVEISDSEFIGNSTNGAGGAVRVGDGDLSITRSTFVENHARTWGGAVRFVGDSLDVVQSRFEANSNQLWGGAALIDAESANIRETTFVANTAETASGVGIKIRGENRGRIEDAIFDGNRSHGSAGALYVMEGVVDIHQTQFVDNWSAQAGGAIYVAGEATVRDSTFERNLASGHSDWADGGAIFVNSGSVDVGRSTFHANRADRFGGAIRNFQGSVQVDRSTFAGNIATAGSGGAISNEPGLSSVVITQSTLSGNSALYAGGAIASDRADLAVRDSTITDNQAGDIGGGVFSTTTTAGRAWDLWDVLQGSTVTSSSTVHGASQAENLIGGSSPPSTADVNEFDLVFADALPGGTVHFVEWQTASPIELRGITLQARADDDGERAFERFELFAWNSQSNDWDPVYQLTSSSPYADVSAPVGTIIERSNNDRTLGIFAELDPPPANRFRAEFTQPQDSTKGPVELDGYSSRRTVLANSIVAGNVAPVAPDLFSRIPVNSGGNNLVGIGDEIPGLVNNVNGDQVGESSSPIDARLAPLQPNGGPTFTHALLPGSPAIDTGVTDAATDQRGFARPQDGNRDTVAIDDRGAFELGETDHYVSIEDAEVVEGNSGTSNVTLRVSLSRVATAHVRLGWSIKPGTASQPDFASASGVIEFRVGEQTKQLTIAINGDAEFEPDETIEVHLTPIQNAVFLKSVSVITIRNDDAIGVPRQPVLSEIESPTADATPTFTWSADPNANRYDMTVMSESSGQVVLRKKRLTETGFELTESLPNGRYLAWVKAFNANGDRSLPSRAVRFEVVAAISQPVVGVVALSRGASRPTIVWTGDSVARFFELSIVDQETQEMVVDVDDLLGRSFTLTADLAAGDYAATVRAFDLSGADGEWSEPLDFSVGAAGGFVVTESQPRTVNESGATATFSVRLLSQPTSDVVLDIGPIDEHAAQVSVNRQSIRFAPENWNQAEHVTIAGVDDLIADGNQVAVIGVSVDRSQSDAAFQSYRDQFVSVVVEDDDVQAPGFTIRESGQSTEVSEAGRSDAFSVVLNRQPTADVVLNVASADSNEVVVSTPSLTFTSDNWDVPQTIVVTGVQDRDPADGDVETAVTLAVDVDASDTSYAAVPPQTVDVLNRSHVSPTTIVLRGTGRVTDFVDVSSDVAGDELDVELRGPGGKILSPGVAGRISLAGYSAGTYEVWVNVDPDEFDITPNTGIGESLGDPDVAALDLDGTGTFNFANDGILLLAHALGARGNQLNGFRGTGSARTGEEVGTVIDQLADSLDLDGDGQFEFSTDGIILLSYALGGQATQVEPFSGPSATRNGDEIVSRVVGLLRRSPAQRIESPNHSAVSFWVRPIGAEDTIRPQQRPAVSNVRPLRPTFNTVDQNRTAGLEVSEDWERLTDEEIRSFVDIGLVENWPPKPSSEPS